MYSIANIVKDFQKNRNMLQNKSVKIQRVIIELLLEKIKIEKNLINILISDKEVRGLTEFQKLILFY